MKNKLNVRIGEVSKGPTLGRKSEVVNVKQLEIFDQRMPELPEWKVKAVISHKKAQKNKKVVYKYLVRWSTGEETWEPLESFRDEGSEGVEYTDAR